MRFLQAFAILFAASLALAQPSPSRLRQDFRDPPKAYRPMVRWWWPGGDVTDEELRREVRLLDEAKFGGGEIQPFVIGLNPKMTSEARKRVNDYLTPAFFSHVRAALEEARSRGMWLDYTFGSGWPFGGGLQVTPELASLELRFAHQSLRGPAHFHDKLAMPKVERGMGAEAAKLSGVSEQMPEGWAERLNQRARLVAVVALRGTEAKVSPRQQQTVMNAEGDVKRTGMLEGSSAVVLNSRVAADGTLDWDVPDGDWQVFSFMQFPADLRVVGGAGEGPQLILDHLRRDAFMAHARRVGDSARASVGSLFGSGLRAIFCDSLEVHAYLFWTEGFLEEFQRRRGYDLTPFLPILKVPGFADPYGAFLSSPLYDIDGVGERVRNDYWQTVSDMMVDNFYQPFADWAAQNKLLARVQAHGSPTDVARVYGLADIPETEDLYDMGRYDFLKMAASASHVYGHKIAASESFVWMGKAYQTTPEKIKRYADELLTAGINEIIYHGFPYEYMDRPEPGWHPFSSPMPFSSHMNAHNPFWPYIPRLNAYMTRLQYLSQEGTNVAPVALYRSQLSYDAIEPPLPEPKINTRLMNAGYNFDHINAEALEKSRVENGKLITPGGASCGALILQNERHVRVGLAEKLAAFRAAKLPVIFIGTVPEGESGYADHERKSQHIRELLQGAQAVPSVSDAVAELSRAVQPNLHFSNASVPFFEKRLGGVDVFFLRNPDPEAKQIDASFAVQGSPELWDPWTGEVKPLDEFERQGNLVRIRLEFDPYDSKLIVFDPAVRHKPMAAVQQAKRNAAPIAIGGQGWKLDAAGRTFELAALVDWSKHPDLKNFSGKGRYTAHFELDSAQLGGKRRVILDLGEVHDVAEILVNGKPGPTLLLRPYRADVTGLVKSGANSLEIVVTNTLYNAISARGDINSFPGMPGLKSEESMPSGLVGPVTLR